MAMSFTEFRQLVFATIAEHDGLWSWYQIDRVIVVAHPEMSSSLMKALRSLEDEGLIRTLPSEHSGQPHYAVTQKGKGNG